MISEIELEADLKKLLKDCCYYDMVLWAVTFRRPGEKDETSDMVLVFIIVDTQELKLVRWFNQRTNTYGLGTRTIEGLLSYIDVKNIQDALDVLDDDEARTQVHNTALKPETR